MGIKVFPTSSGGGIKSVQRGSAVGSGTVTITSVDITKSFVNVFGTASSGAVAGSGTVAATNASINAANMTTNAIGSPQGMPGGNVVRPAGSNTSGGNQTGWCGANYAANQGSFTYTQNFIGNATNAAINSAAISGGSNNLVSAVVQGYLSNSTSLVVSGACRWEVVEFN